MAVIRAYAPSRYGQLHYRIAVPERASAAPPLLCLHQTPGNGADWEPILAALGGTRVVIAADTPGYGMSDPPPAPTSIEDFAAVMEALMTALAADGVVPAGPFDAMGFHTGSVIATELARARADRVRRIVLFGLAAYPAEVRRAKLDNLDRAFPPPANNLDHVEKLWAIISQLSDDRMDAERRHVGMAECLRLGSRMPWGYRSVYGYDFLAAMPQVRQPVLVMNPEDDLWAVTAATSGRFPNGRRHDMPGVKHGVLSIRHDEVLRTVTGFLDEPD